MTHKILSGEFSSNGLSWDDLNALENAWQQEKGNTPLGDYSSKEHAKVYGMIFDRYNFRRGTREVNNQAYGIAVNAASWVKLISLARILNSYDYCSAASIMLKVAVKKIKEAKVYPQRGCIARNHG
jgi:hypothetical protein